MNQPHGGELVNRIATSARKEALETEAKKLFQLTIEDRYGADVEMIAIVADEYVGALEYRPEPR